MLNSLNQVEIKTHALQEAPNECCGFLVGNDFCAVRVKNISDDPRKRFKISSTDFVKFAPEIKAVYHSHLESLGFSEFDKVNSEAHQIPFVLYHVKHETFQVYYPCGYEVPYVGRDFIIGRVDCFSLIKDYYLRELNVAIPDLNHHYRLVEDKANHQDNTATYTILEDFFLCNGFVATNNLQKNDVILTSSLGIKSAVHLAIYLGDNLILHHPFKRKSRIEPLNSFWKRRIILMVRHATSI